MEGVDVIMEDEETKVGSRVASFLAEGSSVSSILDFVRPSLFGVR